MADCTEFGVSGENLQLTNLINTGGGNTKALPALLAGFTQCQNKITVKIFQSGSTEPVAQSSGTSAAAGNTITPMELSPFAINPGAKYYAAITSSGGQTPQVLAAYSTLSFGTVTYAGVYTLCVEDTPLNGDCDFNDCIVSITWTLFAQ